MGRSLEGVLRRRDFISLATGAAVATTLLPSLPVESQECSCGLVTYTRQPEGHFAATHILLHGQWQRFSFQLFCWHNHLHRKSRMQMLMEIGWHRKLTAQEQAETQRYFMRVAQNDARVLRSGS
jgi:hypothetical protein